MGWEPGLVFKFPHLRAWKRKPQLWPWHHKMWLLIQYQRSVLKGLLKWRVRIQHCGDLKQWERAWYIGLAYLPFFLFFQREERDIFPVTYFRLHTELQAQRCSRFFWEPWQSLLPTLLMRARPSRQEPKPCLQFWAPGSLLIGLSRSWCSAFPIKEQHMLESSRASTTPSPTVSWSPGYKRWGCPTSSAVLLQTTLSPGLRAWHYAHRSSAVSTTGPGGARNSGECVSRARAFWVLRCSRSQAGLAESESGRWVCWRREIYRMSISLFHFHHEAACLVWPSGLRCVVQITCTLGS